MRKEESRGGQEGRRLLRFTFMWKPHLSGRRCLGPDRVTFLETFMILKWRNKTLMVTNVELAFASQKASYSKVHKRSILRVKISIATEEENRAKRKKAVCVIDFVAQITFVRQKVFE